MLSRVWDRRRHSGTTRTTFVCGGKCVNWGSDEPLKNREAISLSFLETSLQLFRQKYAPDLGAEQYAHHTGVDRNGNPMSGALLWAKAEAQRISNVLVTDTTNMVDAELKLAQKLHGRVRDYVQWHHQDERCRKGISVLEYGPGTVRAFQQKTLPLVIGLRGETSRCTLVDRSREFLGDIAQLSSALGLKIEFIRGDIFSGRRYFSTMKRHLLSCLAGHLEILLSQQMIRTPWKRSSRR
ncbi:hypothetical protein SFHH103_psfHH103d_172 (plasmid) [Sinorhizobium fredii HH103]|nr:hypothetical protein SFHH103_psfHH103d_172 [Sinorhizobium fredii HH103]